MAKRSFNTIAQGAAIRMADGVICPATPKILAQPGFQEYHGPLHLTGAEALAHVRGQNSGRRVVLGLEETFDLRTAGKEELLEFAETDYGVTLDATDDVEVLRNKVRQIVRQQREEEKAAELARNQRARAAAVVASQGTDDDGDGDEPQKPAQPTPVAPPETAAEPAEAKSRKRANAGAGIATA